MTAFDEIDLVCPLCGSAEFYSSEVLIGSAAFTAIIDKMTGERHINWSGHTDVDWDSSQTTSLVCSNCGMDFDSENDFVTAEDYAGNTTVLVALDLEDLATDRSEALAEALRLLTALRGFEPRLSWWIAQDDRTDGSDNDSAVFVPKGSEYAWKQRVKERREDS